MTLSRLEKIGTVYSRMSFLLKHGTVRPEYKPVWMDIYEAFPPIHEPRWDRKSERQNEPIPKIIYKEDFVRARFYKQFGERHEVYSMNDNRAESVSQKFVRQYMKEEEENPGMPDEDLFRQAVDKLDLAGLNLSQMDHEGARKGLVSDRSTGGRDSRDEWRRQKEEEAGSERRPQRTRLERPSFAELFSEAKDGSDQKEKDK
jgi:small subunit ribosomal protein S23